MRERHQTRRGVVDLVWCFYGWRHSSIARDKRRCRCSSSQPKLDVPGSTPGPAPARGSAAPRSTSKPQIASEEGRRPCTQQSSRGPVLYALAASQPALSQQTRKHSYRFTHHLPQSPYNISGLLPFPLFCRSGSNHLTEFRAYLYVLFTVFLHF